MWEPIKWQKNVSARIATVFCFTCILDESFAILSCKPCYIVRCRLKNTVNIVYGKVRHPERMLQEHNIRVSNKVPNIPVDNFTINIEHFTADFHNCRTSSTELECFKAAQPGPNLCPTGLQSSTLPMCLTYLLQECYLSSTLCF
jgi:hypothetical protein